MPNDLHLTNAMVFQALLAVSLLTVMLTTLLGELRTLLLLAGAATVAVLLGYARVPALMNEVFFVLLVDGIVILPSLALAIGVGKLMRFGLRRMQRR